MQLLAGLPWNDSYDSRREEPTASCPRRTGCSRTRRTALRGNISLVLGGSFVTSGRRHLYKVSDPSENCVKRSFSP